MHELVNLLNDLSLSDDRKGHLIKLKTILLAYTTSQYERLPPELDLNMLFDSFNSTDNEQIELCVDVLGQLLPYINAQTIIERSGEQLQRGLLHPHEKVRSLVLKQLLLCAKTEAGALAVIKDGHLLRSIIRCCGDKSLGVVKIATDTLHAICHHSGGLNATFSSDSTTAMQEVMSKSDSCRFNIYELIIKVSLIGDVPLSVVSNSGFLDNLTTEVTTGDILTQLTALEVLTPLALNSSGLNLLHKAGVIAKLQYLLSLAETDPMAALLMPGLIKFFGNMGHSRPQQMMEEYGSVMQMILRLAAGSLDLGDATLQVVAVETVAHIGSSLEGKLALAKFNNEMNSVLDFLGSKIRTAPTEQRVRILEALGQLFFLQVECQTEELVGLLELWWSGVGGVNLEKIVSVARQPFVDLHCAALGVINSIASMPWGQNLIFTEPGLIEYILDRNSETEKLGKEAKWNIVSTLVQNQSINYAIPENYKAPLEKFYRQGPFYIETVVEVALEGHN